MTVLAKPSMVTNLKLRYGKVSKHVDHQTLLQGRHTRRTCFLPSIAMSLASAAVPWYFTGTEASTSNFGWSLSNSSTAFSFFLSTSMVSVADPLLNDNEIRKQRKQETEER